MISYHIGTTTLLITTIDPDSTHLSRADRERKAVMSLISEAFGSDASYLHRSDGSPYIEGSDINISVSHCNRFAVLAYDPQLPIGVDIEQQRAQLLRIKHKFLSPEQMTDYSDRLLEAWTSKEALYKVIRQRGVALTSIALPHPDYSLTHINIDNDTLLTLAQRRVSEC